MTRKRSKTNTAEVGFANALLEAVANASGAGWFSDGQQKRLRAIVCAEFSDLMDAGLLYNTTQLDRFEHQSELSCFPNGDRPNHEPDGAPEEDPPVDTDDPPMDITVDDVVISPPITDDDPPHEQAECASPTLHPNCRVISIE